MPVTKLPGIWIPDCYLDHSNYGLLSDLKPQKKSFSSNEEWLGFQKFLVYVGPLNSTCVIGLMLNEVQSNIIQT